MTRLCSDCLQKLLTKQLGFPVIAENDVQTVSGKLVGVTVKDRNLTVIINVENTIYPERFRFMGWIAKLEFSGDLPFGCVKRVTWNGRESER